MSVGGTRNGFVGDGGRYSKEDMLSIYTAQKELGLLGANLSRIFAGPWDLEAPENSSSHSKDPGPDVCWNTEPKADPLGLKEMDDTERQVFTRALLPTIFADMHSFSQLQSIRLSSSIILRNPLPLPQVVEKLRCPK